MEYRAILSFFVIALTVTLFVIGIRELDFVCTADVCKDEATHLRDDYMSQKETWFYIFIGFIILGGVTGVLGLVRDTAFCFLSCLITLLKTVWVGLMLCLLLFVLFIISYVELQQAHTTHVIPQLNCTVTCDVQSGEGNSARLFMIGAIIIIGAYSFLSIFFLSLPADAVSYSLVEPLSGQ